jgi:hypothetical protein
MKARCSNLLALLGAAVAIAGCGKDAEKAPVSSSSAALVAACAAEDSGALPANAWVCPNPHRMECANEGTGSPEVIYVQPSNVATCDEMALSVHPGPFSTGVHSIIVTDSASPGSPEVCRAELTVVDTTAPVVRTRNIELWPPNHKMRSIDIDDCLSVNDACDPAPRPRILWVTGDEAGDGKGDGNTEPDAVVTGCNTVDLRAERSGNANGRIYEVGFVVTDASGNESPGVCRVVVPHDQGHSGSAQPGAPAWRITAPPGCER